MNLHDLGEFGFIARRKARLQKRAGVEVGIGDDAAILASLHTPVVTCDALIENVHFRRDWSTPFLLGRKAMNVNVSDLAAKGARPVAAFVSLGVSARMLRSSESLAWLDALYEGFESAAEEYDFTVAGGDTVRVASEIMLSVTLIGEVDEESRRRGAPILRSGAQSGDVLCVTGTLGDSAAGLFLLAHPELAVAPDVRAFLIARHLDPTPRSREMAALLNEGQSTPGRVLTASLDLSDGLFGDAAHIAKASLVQIEIETASLPISAACREAARAARENGFDVSAEQWALSGGEDYELLLCAPREAMALLSQVVARTTSTPVTIIGRCVQAQKNAVAAAPVLLLHPDGRRDGAHKAWTHF